MKAAVCRRFGEPLQIEELELGPPRAGEVAVRIAACAICHSDISYMDGDWGGDLPQVFGHEAAGVVTATGDGVGNVAPGDHVIVTLIRSCGHCPSCERGRPYVCEGSFARDQDSALRDRDGNLVKQGLKTGAFAEAVVVDASQVVAIPVDLPFDSASLLACGVITGYGAVVNTAAITAASSVAVIGCGGVGLNSVQGAALHGAYPVVAIDLVDSKLEAARDFGATHTVNAATEAVGERIAEITGGRGIDNAFVAAGSTRAVQTGLEIIGRSGTLVLVGMPPVGHKTEVETLDIADASQRILGSKMGSTRLRVDVPKLVELYQQGRLKLDELISGRYPLAQINEAIEEVRSDRALRNVIVFE